MAKVKATGADLGIAFDGDADRIGAVDEAGNVVWGDMLLLIYGREILSRKPGATFIGEVKCSQIMYDELNKLGGNAIMFKTGHSLIKAKMKEAHAELAGEMSGHMFFADRYFGFDDALYSACRLIEIVSNSGQPLSAQLAGLPKSVTTPEIRVDCPDEAKFAVVATVAEQFKQTHKVVDVDGVRVIFEKGWGLLRASNTQPVLVERFEAENEELLKQYREELEAVLQQAQGDRRAAGLEAAVHLSFRLGVAVLRPATRCLSSVCHRAFNQSSRAGTSASGVFRRNRRTMATAFSAIISVGALVLPLVMRGMTEASTTRSPETPAGPVDTDRRRRRHRCRYGRCPPGDRGSRSYSRCTRQSPRVSEPLRRECLRGRARGRRRGRRRFPERVQSRGEAVRDRPDRSDSEGSMAGWTKGSAVRRRMRPVLRGRRCTGPMVNPCPAGRRNPCSRNQTGPKRNCSSGSCRGKGAGLGDVGSQRSAPAQEPAGEVRQALGGSERDGSGAGVETGRARWSLEILADAGQVSDHGDAERVQVIGWADAAEHEQLGRIDGAATQQDFTLGADGVADAVLNVFDGHGAIAIKDDSGGHGAGDDLEVGSIAGGPEIGGSGAQPSTGTLGDAIDATAPRFGTVEIGRARDAALFASVEEDVATGD